MNGFDAAASTAHYLQMIDPAREAQAIAYTHGSHWLMFWGWLMSIAADIIILRSTVLVQLRDRIQRDGYRPNLTAFLCVTAFVGTAWIIHLPWAIYADWARERSYGLSNQHFTTWMVQSLVAACVTSLLVGVVSIPLYALMRRTGARWWAWACLIVALMTFLAIAAAPILVTRLTNDARPLPAGEVHVAVDQLARKAGIPADRIVVIDGSRQSDKYTATVTGGPGFATIQLSDTMLRGKVDLPQVRAVVAHEIGHYAHNHLLILSTLVALLASAGLWLVNWVLASVTLNRTGQTPIIQDPSVIPLAHMIFVTFTLLTTPLILSGERWIEQNADAYGLRLANEPDGAAKALIRTVDFRASSPGRIEETLFYDHPSISARVQRAMEWKRAHSAKDIENP